MHTNNHSRAHTSTDVHACEHVHVHIHRLTQTRKHTNRAPADISTHTYG